MSWVTLTTDRLRINSTSVTAGSIDMKGMLGRGYDNYTYLNVIREIQLFNSI